MCLGESLVMFNLFEVLRDLWIWMFFSLSIFGKFPIIIPLNELSAAFSFPWGQARSLSLWVQAWILDLKGQSGTRIHWGRTGNWVQSGEPGTWSTVAGLQPGPWASLEPGTVGATQEHGSTGLTWHWIRPWAWILWTGAGASRAPGPSSMVMRLGQGPLGQAWSWVFWRLSPWGWAWYLGS